VLLHSFIDAIEACPDPSTRSVLNLVCDLFALSTIETERGWFAEHGRLTAARSKSVAAEVNALCQEIRPIAGDLVDAFSIPEHLIAAELLR
jgi:acyl-CoA oxidase